MIGKVIGPYEVVAKLGEGGMGEVYRATDTNLKRQVAIKVLPESVATDRERLARFQREAEVLAALNHPNIAQIHGLERAEGHVALVMELVEGPTLADLIARGHPEGEGASSSPRDSVSAAGRSGGAAATPEAERVRAKSRAHGGSGTSRGGGAPRGLSLDDALSIARQMAEALEAAHERGIVHRDLKPANIKVRADGTVKVLDFGLAKALAPEGASATADAMNSPTLTSPAMTEMGMILGTAAYMAPEQARGRAVDRRADIWAFGAVLFEMLTGQRAFPGEDVTDTLALVVRGEPAWDRLPPDVPRRVRQVLRACLQKDPKHRMGDMQSVRLALEGAFETVAPGAGDAAPPVAAAPRSAVARALPWAMAAVLGVALGLALWAPWRAQGPADRPLVRANLDLPGYVDGSGNLALSRDGTRIAYVVRGDDGKTRLATRLLAESKATVLAGTEGANSPFFSPDGQWIGFGADGQLKKVLALGGAPLKLTDAPALLGGSWTDDGFIVAMVNVSGEIRRIPEAGGAGKTLLPPWAGGAALPQVLPGGKAVIFGGQDAQGPAVKMLSLETKNVSTLIPGASDAEYLPTNGTNSGATGHLVYRNGNTLLAAPFDPGAGALRGPAVPVLDDVGGEVVVSSAGDVLYPIGAASADSGWPLEWLLPNGKTEPLLEAKARYTDPSVSPDGKLLAVTVDGDRPAEAQLVVYDWRNDRTLALTEKGQMTGAAVWTPDSRDVIWATPATDGKRRFLWRRADGSGDTHTLVESSTYLGPAAVSPDGKHLAMHVWGGDQTRIDLSVAPLDLSKPGEMTLGEARPLVRLPGTEARPVFSPDGRWVAYFSDESGAWEVYVQRFPGGGGHRQVSEGGGIYPKWSSNGRQLLYIEPRPDRIMAVDYQGNGGAFVASKPRPWSATPIRLIGINDSWGLDPKRDRAVVIPVQASPENAGPPKVAYLLHFFDYLRRKAPVGK